MAKKKTSSYTDKDIVIQEGTDGIRHSITMYLGELGDNMVARVVKEPRDNSYDEYVAGRNDLIEQVMIPDQNLYIVADGGNGIPIGIKTLKSGHKINTLQAIFTMAHAGGKMSDSAYKSSSGTHGVGCAASNAACESLVVYTHYQKKWHTQTYKAGEPTSKVKVVKSVPKDVMQHLSKKPAKYGTIVVLKPDQTIVSVDATKGGKKKKNLTFATMDLKAARSSLSDLALINHKLEVVCTTIDKKGKASTETFLNKKDVGEFVRFTATDNELTLDSRTPFMIDNENISMAMSWTSSTMDTLYFRSYVNASVTVDGGTHVNGMRDALMAALKPHLGKQKIKAASVMFGAVGFINWRMHGAQYDSQVKDKLVSKVDKDVRALLEKPLTDFFNKNKALAKKIIKRATEAEKAQEQLQKTMKNMTEVRKKGRNVLPECLISCPDAKPEVRELFIVEGDSAGGTAKYARNNTYQEVFKLRGKILNCLSAPLDKILGSQVIQSLIVSLGLDLKSLDVKADQPQFDVSKLRVQYVNILADADPDGFHIANLITTFFYRLCPEFIKQGRLRFIKTPLYVTDEYKGDFFGGMTIEELRQQLPKGAKVQITRAKGLGELDPPQLKKFGFQPEHRIEIVINYFKDGKGEQWYRQISDESPAAKRKLLGVE